MDWLNQLINSLGNVPPAAWVLLGSALGISTLQQGIVHKVQELKEKPKTNFLITVLLSGVAASLDTIITSLQGNPHALGKYSLLVLSLATISYRFFVQPVYTKTSGVLSDAQEFRRMKAAAATQNVAIDSGV